MFLPIPRGVGLMLFHEIARETLFFECDMRNAPLNDVRPSALSKSALEAPQAHARKPFRSWHYRARANAE